MILRTQEFAVLKAIGMTQQAVRKMIVLEGVLCGMLAAVYGTLIGTALYYVICRFLSGAIDLEWAMPWYNMGVAFAGVIAVTLAASLGPTRKLGKNSVTDLFRTTFQSR